MYVNYDSLSFHLKHIPKKGIVLFNYHLFFHSEHLNIPVFVYMLYNNNKLLRMNVFYPLVIKKYFLLCVCIN